MSSQDIRLALFLSASLGTWEAIGTFDREIALYRRLQDKGVRITLVSPGGRDELGFAKRIPGMRILCNWIGWQERRYMFRQHQLHWLRLRACNLLKTNQLSAGLSATRTSQALDKPLIARMGYWWTHNLKQLRFDRKNPRMYNWYSKVEDDAMRQAARVVTTTEEMRQGVIGKVPSAADKSVVLPNYVDTDEFKPTAAKKRYDLIYIGHLSPIKNLFNLMLAVQRSGVSIAICGDGPMEEVAWQELGDLDGKIHWLGRVKHEALPMLLAASRALILPSYSEGHPKVVIEGMAAGLPVIGTNVSGIRATVQHRQTGYLCETDADSIAAAITTVLSQPDLMRQLGQNARTHAVEHFSLDRLVEREYALYQEVLAERRARQ